METTTFAAPVLSESQEEALIELAYYGGRGDSDETALAELISMGLVTFGHRRGRVELTDDGRRIHQELCTKGSLAHLK